VLGEKALAEDARFAKNADRVRNRDVLITHLQALLARWEMAALLEALDMGGVPAGPINTLSQVFDNPQVEARKMRLTLQSDTMGEVPGVRCPLRMSGAEIGSALPPPGLGEHTAAVVAALLGTP
jgi:crotonobetainyl-CoA:carnitine CoA-transferase CaiB-like acyl-CoA transferase